MSTADLVTRLRAVVPDFCRRPLSWADDEAVCAQERLDLVVRPWRMDEQLFRRPRRLIIDARLTPAYRTFVAWHGIGHWVLHPGGEVFYLERGWLSPIECQASLVGWLALAPWTQGAPYPILTRAVVTEEALELAVEFPETVWRGRPITWRRVQTALRRYTAAPESGL